MNSKHGNLKYGDTREDGYFFSGYTKNKLGKIYESWRSPESWEKEQIRVRSQYPKRKQKVQELNALKKKQDPIKYCAYHLLHGAKFRSKTKNIPFDLDVHFIEEKIKSGKCEVTGIPFFISDEYQHSGKPHQSPYSPSLDQIHPSKGYTKNNIRVTILMFNVARKHWKDEDILTMAKALVVTCQKYEKF
jgi:hypothetical protein